MLFDQLEFFLVLKTAHIVHLSQLVQLAQGQASFTQIFECRLAVVLTDILIARCRSIVYFAKNHTVFITPALRHHRVLEVPLFRAVVRPLEVWRQVVQVRA